jgi:uncharacterized protein (DUF2236 family)
MAEGAHAARRRRGGAAGRLSDGARGHGHRTPCEAVDMTLPAGRLVALGERLASVPIRLPLAAAGALAAPVRDDMRRSVRRSLGVPADPPPRVTDPAQAFLPPGGVARQVHGDLPSMVIGGLAALLLQTLHPLAMAGVAEHSSYQDDPIGRLRRTASFVGATSFGTVDQAMAAIERVREVHRRVHGRAPDGRPYSANDPELLTWVHVAEMYSFLTASLHFGPHRLSDDDCDRYFAETAIVARSLGARWVPESRDEVQAYFQRVQPDLYAGPQALVARDFLLRGVARRPNDRAVYAIIVGAALTILPGWARAELGIPAVPLADKLLVMPVARAFCAALRWTVDPAPAAHPSRCRPQSA